MKTVNIFTPIYHRFTKTKQSVESMIDSIYTSINNVHLCIGINGIENDDMRKWVDSMGKLNRVTLFDPKENYGKAKVINAMYKVSRAADYVISIDSDMIAHEHNKYNWIDELVKVMEADSKKAFGVLSTWQDESNCHVLNSQHLRTKIINHEIWHGSFGGVAGGCIILRNDVFRKIDGYTVLDVYNGDDALLMRKINGLGLHVGIVSSIKLRHPNNLPEEGSYQAWKIKKAHGAIPAGSKGFWDK